MNTRLAVARQVEELPNGKVRVTLRNVLSAEEQKQLNDHPNPGQVSMGQQLYQYVDDTLNAPAIGEQLVITVAREGE